MDSGNFMSGYRCPVCGGRMSLKMGKSLVCDAKKAHVFDLARSGYVNLSQKQSATGDSKEAVWARSTFFELDPYRSLRQELVRLSQTYLAPGKAALDAGCGEGYYTNAMASGCPDSFFFGVDLSKFAVDHAAKEAKRLAAGRVCYAVASVSDLPFYDRTFSLVTSVFAPCDEEEFFRVLEPGGVLVLAAAGPGHLLGLKRLLYEHPYLNEERRDLPQDRKLLFKKRISDRIEVEGEERISALFEMTPYYWRTREADREKLKGLQTLQTEVEFDLYVYQKDT